MNEQFIKLSVDAVVFGYEEGTISILLIRRKYQPFKGEWAIPGGFILNNESLEESPMQGSSQTTTSNPWPN